MPGRALNPAAFATALCTASALLQPALAQESWKPTRPVTLIAPNAPGGTSDRTARELQRIFQKERK